MKPPRMPRERYPLFDAFWRGVAFVVVSVFLLWLWAA